MANPLSEQFESFDAFLGRTGFIYTVEPEQETDMTTSIERRREVLLRQLEELDRIEQAQAKFLNLRGLTVNTVIKFDYQFNPGGTMYQYAAIRSNDGQWYTTGPRSPKGYSTDDLIRWLTEAEAVRNLRVMLPGTLL